LVNFFLKKDLNGGVDCADEEEAADEPSEAGEHKEGVGQDTCMSFEEEDTCMSCEEEDTCMSYEEEDTCLMNPVKPVSTKKA
jgi:hypothetical protein